MATITITIEVPDGADVTVTTEEASHTSPDAIAPDAVRAYWSDYLSDNGRRLYRAAAVLERHKGPFTLGALAQAMSITYGSVQSYHRTSGRSARKWRDDRHVPAPIRLDDLSYTWVPEENGMRTTYRLPPGVADIVAML